jgi:hypothetical protein
MVWILLIFAFAYSIVIILSDDPRITFPRLATKLTPGQQQLVERLREWIERLHVKTFLLLFYVAVVLWLMYKYLP